MIEIGKVLSSNPGTIHILLNSIEDFERNKEKIRISRYICIEDGNNLKILASIQNVSAVQSNDGQTLTIQLLVLQLEVIMRLMMRFHFGKVV